MDKKWNVISKLTKGKVNDVTTSFMQIILRKHREMILKEIFSQFIEMYREKQGIISASVFTAYPIGDDTKKTFENYLVNKTKKKVELNAKVKEDVLGGFVLQYDDKLVDASVSTQLKTLRKTLIHN